VLPQNEELEDLFEVAKRQFAPPTDSDGDFAALAYDDLPELDRSRDAPPSPASSRATNCLCPAGNQSPASRRPISGLATPTFVR
jgi:hypothetical protein